jgi:F-type H+-transporting ATPase subunit b
MHNEAWFHDPKYSIALAFVIFIGVFVRYVLPHVLRALDARSDAIRAQLEQAETLRKEAEALLAQYQQRYNAILAEAEAMVTATREDVRLMKERAETELNATIERRRAQAEESIAQMETKARREIMESMVDIASANARQLMVQQLDTMKEDPTVAQVISQIQRNLH